MKGRNTIYNYHQVYPFSYLIPMYTPNHLMYTTQPIHYPYEQNTFAYYESSSIQYNTTKDYGPNPFALNIEAAAEANNYYRKALWTGKNLQVTLMSINVGDDIGLEVHSFNDQFLRIEQGSGLLQMGDSKDQLNFQQEVFDDYAIMIPAGKWHNVINTGTTPMKLYAIYAPPEHPFGTIHETKEIAQAAEDHYGNY